MCHLGISKTTFIMNYYYWPKMREEIKFIINNCMLCQAQNPNYYHMPRALPLKKNFKPLQVWHFDSIKLLETP